MDYKPQVCEFCKEWANDFNFRFNELFDGTETIGLAADAMLRIAGGTDCHTQCAHWVRNDRGLR